jgi:hypothetical protein
MHMCMCNMGMCVVCCAMQVIGTRGTCVPAAAMRPPQPLAKLLAVAEGGAPPPEELPGWACDAP